MDNQSNAWSNYWLSGKPSTFGGLDDLLSNPALSDLWRKYLGSRLGSHVLEIGCGNGALTRFLPSVDGVAERKVQAIDIAKLSSELRAVEGVTFHEETAAENLPFDDGVFDSVVSQFGFEYADFNPAVKELARVCKADATVTFISHHRSSWLCRDSFDILRQVLAIEESAILVTLDALLNQLALLHKANRDPAKDSKAEKYRELLNVTSRELQDSAKEISADTSYTLRFLDAIFKVFDQDSRQGLDHLQYIDEISRSMHAYKHRLESQKRSAHDDTEWDVRRESFEAAGFIIERFEPSVINGYHFGQAICLRKSS